MTAAKILNEQWEAYNRRKALAQQDDNFFCPDEPWEFNYLMDIIVHVSPQLDPITVMLAIRQSSRETMAPRPRQHFVQVVMESIVEREERFAQIISDTQQDAA